MQFIVDSNTVHEDDLMKIFASCLNGKNTWDWYCDYNPKEIVNSKLFEKKSKILDAMIKKHATNLYEVCFWVDICAKILKQNVGLIIVHEKHPSSSLFVEIKKINVLMNTW